MMSTLRWRSVVLALAALAVAALADGGGYSSDGAGAAPPPYAPATQDNTAGASVALPYPYAQAQKDTQQHQYPAQQLPYSQQQTGYESGYPGYYPGVPDPAFALEAAGGTAVAVAVKAVAWVVSHVAALALGGVLALAVCKLTPLCSLVAHKWDRAELPTPEEVRAFTQPAADMLRAALHKYTDLNNQHH